MIETQFVTMSVPSKNELMTNMLTDQFLSSGGVALIGPVCILVCLLLNVQFFKKCMGL